MMRPRCGLVALGLLAVACINPEKSPQPVENSTYRIGEVVQDPENELDLQILRNRTECRVAVGPAETDDCIPQVNRQNGEVRLSFRMREPRTGDSHALALHKDLVQVKHMGSPVGAQPGQLVELNPRGPMRTGQLFIVLIDGSGSMYDNDAAGLTKVYNALKDPSVIDAFYPGDVPTGVVLLRFTKEVQGLDGLKPVVLDTRKRYKEMLAYINGGPRGFTHLYDAVTYAVGDMMEEKSIEEWRTVNTAEPTIIALTDGFNNERGDDNCSTNAPRLQAVLENISTARQKASFQDRPTLFTVGLGRALRKGFVVPADTQTVRPAALCGRYANSVINAGIERMGIDNASLAWMARAGGGETFVKNNDKGLAEVFKAAAAVRYRWFQVRYKVDSYYHRRTFATHIGLLAFARSGAEVTFHPSAWLDGPSVEAEGGQWRDPLPIWAMFSPLMVLLGTFVLVHFMGPAGFNVRRALFVREIATGAAKDVAQPPGEQPPSAPPGS